MKNLMLCPFLLLAACGGEPGQAAWVPELPVDTLAPVLTIGQEFGDSTTTFGLIQDALILPGGEILVLDRQGACVKVFGPSGEYRRQVSRRGGAPGELSMPWEFFLMPDGRLLVLEFTKLGFIVFDRNLEFVEEISHWVQNPPFLSTALSDSTIVAYKIDVDMVDDQIVMNRRIAVYTLGNKDFDTVLWEDSLTASMNQIMENPSMFITDLLDAFCLGGDGTGKAFFSEKRGDTYEVLGWNQEGERFFRVSLDLPRVQKSPEEMEEERIYMNLFLQNMGSGMPFSFEPEPYRDMVTGLGVGPDGNLWVQRGTTDTPFFDIFDFSGNLTGHAVFPETGWSWTFSISTRGILAWEADPVLGFQKLHLLERVP